MNRSSWETPVKRLNAENLFKIVREQDIHGQTLLHMTWMRQQYDIIHDLTKKLHFDQLLEVLKVPDTSYHTALGRASVMMERRLLRVDQFYAF